MKMTIEFMTLDDGYATTQGAAFIDGAFLCVKQGRGEFDVLAKISKFYTDYTIEQVMGELNPGYDKEALEDHVARLVEQQKRG